MSVNEKMTELADAVRELTGVTEKLSLDAMIQNIRGAISSAVISSAMGSVVNLSDSLARKFYGLTLYGKTTQNGTPTPTNPVELETVGADGDIVVNVHGKNLFDISKVVAYQESSTGTELQGNALRIFSKNTSGTFNSTKSNSILLQAGMTYTISLNMDTYVSGDVYCGFRTVSTNTFVSASLIGKMVSTGKYSLAYTSTEDVEVYLSIAVTWSTAGVSGDATFSNIQVEVGDVATEFEPYRSQKLTVSTPNGLPGIPVTSGGNYTDDKGQQWICDEIDFARGKYVQRVYRHTFTGQESFSSYDSGKTVGGNMVNLGLPSCIAPKKDSGRNVSPMLFTHGKVTTHLNIVNNVDVGIAIAIWGVNQYVYFSGSYYGNIDGLKTAVAEAYASGNPYVWIYAMETPVETDLTAEELFAYSNLRTYHPNTTIYNDEGAGMRVSYAADTKLYIDQKTAALAEAILNN